MEQETSQSETDVNNDHELVRRRAILAAEFHALPTYGSADFWRRVEEPQLKLALTSITDHRYRVLFLITEKGSSSHEVSLLAS
jgi:hypothetical protein